MADWTPALLSGDILARWFDAGQNDVLVDNTAVDYWVDSSPNETNITAVGYSGNAKPTIQTAEINSLPVMRFSGTNYFDTEGACDVTGDQFAMFFVCKRSVATGTDAKDDFWTSRSPNDAAFSSHGWSTFTELSSDTVFSYAVDDWGPGFVYSREDDGLWHVRVEVFNRLNSIGSLDGTAEIVQAYSGEFAAAGDLTGANIDNGISIAWDIGPAGAGVPAFSLTGDMAEFGIIQGPLSVAGREVLEGYMAHKYALTDNLPAEHPYKSTAPQDDTITEEEFLVVDEPSRKTGLRFALGSGLRQRSLG